MKKVVLWLTLAFLAALLGSAVQAQEYVDINVCGLHPFCKCRGVKSDKDFVKYTEKFEKDIITGFDMAGNPELAQPYINAVRAGNFSSGSVPVGTTYKWMLLRKLGKIQVIHNPRWMGKEALESYAVSFKEGDTDYVFQVPKACFNIALQSATVAYVKPKIPPTAGLTLTTDEHSCVKGKGTIDASSSKDPDGRVAAVQVKVYHEGTQVDAFELKPPFVKDYVWSQVGKYTVSAVAVDDEGLESAPVEKSVVIKECPPTCGIRADKPEIIFGDRINIDASSSSDINGRVESVDVTVMRDGKPFMTENLSSPFVWSPKINKVGHYTVTAVAVDNDGYKSSNECSSAFVAKRAFHFVVDGGVMKEHKGIQLVDDGPIFTDCSILVPVKGGFSAYLTPNIEVVGLGGIAFHEDGLDKSKGFIDGELDIHQHGLFFGWGAGVWDFTRDDPDFDVFMNLGYDLLFKPGRKVTLYIQGRAPVNGVGDFILDDGRVYLGLRIEL
jgi:hypothetical protein